MYKLTKYSIIIKIIDRNAYKYIIVIIKMFKYNISINNSLCMLKNIETINIYSSFFRP
ncbi:MAG: hypothetical protein AMDU4_FER2C00271G0001 [Ferroplasma sp. Type II]|nr:MAG: hypothetical protein AMDU4_FER2C00271G0001 [Ferroplasma sp. Type II]